MTSRHLTPLVLCVLATLAALTTSTTSRADSTSTNTPALSWSNPAYGAWRSCVMGGGGWLVRIVQSPSSAKRMYLYGDMDGLFRSDDEGNSWRIIHGNMDIKEGHYEFAGVAVSPQNPDRIAVACGGQDGPRQGVFISNDGGATWTKMLDVRFMGNGPYRWAGARLTGNCGAGGTLLAASEGSGVWMSDDGGRTWKDCGLKNIYFTDSRIDRTNPQRAWLCAEAVHLDGGESRDLAGGFYRTDDGGNSWNKLSGDSPFEILQDPVQPGILYGLYNSSVKRSTDGGSTWQTFMGGLPSSYRAFQGSAPFYAIGAGPDFVTIVQKFPTVIYRLDCGQSQWRKIDPAFDQRGWTLNFMKPPAGNASSILVSSANPNHWYMTDAFALSQSIDGGRNWTTTNRGIETTVIHTMVQDPSGASNVYLGAGDVGFWWSDNNGKNLTQTTSDGAGWIGNVKCIDVSAKDPSRVYAVGGEGWSSDRMYVSTDYGRHMTRLSTHGNGLPSEPFNCNTIVVDPADASSVYLTTSLPIKGTSGGVYHSADGGKSWSWIGEGLPVDLPVFLKDIWWGGRQLAAGPGGNLLACSAACNGVYRYDHEAARWSKVSFPHGGGVYCIASDPQAAGRFYVSVVCNDVAPVGAEGGLFRTDDAGGTWTKVLPGSVHAVAVDCGVKNRIAATTPEGVFVSNNSGATWTKLETMPNRWYCTSLAFAGNRLLAATGGNGAFWADLPGGALARGK